MLTNTWDMQEAMQIKIPWRIRMMIKWHLKTRVHRTLTRPLTGTIHLCLAKRKWWPNRINLCVHTVDTDVHFTGVKHDEFDMIIAALDQNQLKNVVNKIAHLYEIQERKVDVNATHD